MTGSPFAHDGIAVEPGMQLGLRIADGHYVFHSDDETQQLQSTNTNPNTIAAGADSFTVSLYKNSAAVLEK